MVSARDTVEIAAEQAAMGQQLGCAVLSYNDSIALNSIRGSYILPALAKEERLVARYAPSLYARALPSPLFLIDDW